jgi:hypothetical protein
MRTGALSGTQKGKIVNNDAVLAAGLIGTCSLPPGLNRVRELAREARCYHLLDPYPLYHFRDWKTEDRGPLPRCLPIAKSVVRRGARWLFGDAPTLHCPENPKLEQFVRSAWSGNRLSSRMVAVAENAGLDGGVVLKFSYDASDRCPLSVQSLSLVDEVRLFYHPHDWQRLLMARVQYPFFDASDGKTYWYREEWTADEEVRYKAVANEMLFGTRETAALASGNSLLAHDVADVYEGWEIDSRKKNPFGIIPLTSIKNVETDDLWGAGDLWDLYRALDRIHLTYHLMDRSNQFDSEVNAMFIDLSVNDRDIDRPVQPGQPIDLKSDNHDTGRQGKVDFRPTGNSLRPAMMEYAKELNRQVLEAASSSSVDQSEITNKGNLTTAVLEQLYWPQIVATKEKRKTFGDDGLVPFFALVAEGLTNAGLVDLGYSTHRPESFTVSLQWQPFFTMSPGEKSTSLATIQQAQTSNYLTADEAAREASGLFNA